VSSGALEVCWPVAAPVRAVCTQRQGGISQAQYHSLNLATHVGDEPERVAENRRRLRRQYALPAEPVWLEQVHGVQVACVDQPGAPMVADAAVTHRPGQVLAVLVADCLPVLFASRNGDVVGVAHAGWRGLAAGVLEATVAALGVAPELLCAWLGPVICAAHFEVGDEVRNAFALHDPEAVRAFTLNARGRWQCDLQALARQRLAALGVHTVAGCPPCTYAEADQFFSFRRDGQTGRMAALIWIDPQPS
jgi:polyphenol oxidase